MVNHLLAAVLAATVSEQLVGGATFSSPPLARELAYLLQSSALVAFAAADPERDGAFVAVLYVPEQLLLIEATHPATALLEGRVRAQQYREAYFDLQATPTPHGRFFVLDAGADGLLRAVPGRAPDLIDDGQGPVLLFNGDASGQRLSADDYDARIRAADASYARLLTILTRALENRRERPDSSGP
jgi:hypothetical protein